MWCDTDYRRRSGEMKEAADVCLCSFSGFFSLLLTCKNKTASVALRLSEFHPL